MITLFILLVLCVVLSCAFHITGALFKALFWMLVLLPLVVVIWSFAAVCCVTVILIPLGIILFKIGGKMLFPC